MATRRNEKAVAHPRSCRGRYGWQATARPSGPPKRSAHRQLSDTGGPGAKPGVFRDRDLIQNALFLGAKLLSKDKGVKKRRRYVACVVPKAHRAMEEHLVQTLPPLQGLDNLLERLPRAALRLPWAILFRSDGALI